MIVLGDFGQCSDFVLEHLLSSLIAAKYFGLGNPLPCERLSASFAYDPIDL